MRSSLRSDSLSQGDRVELQRKVKKFVFVTKYTFNSKEECGSLNMGKGRCPIYVHRFCPVGKKFLKSIGTSPGRVRIEIRRVK